MFGISPWQLLIILVIVVLIFGTKKLRNVGGDVGGAVKNFKDAMKDGEDEVNQTKQVKQDDGDVIEGEVKKEDKQDV